MTVDSFEPFVRSHSTSLLRTAYLLAGDRAAAEDLLQDTLTRLYPNWSRVEAADAPVAYVRRCLLNEFLNARRRHSPQTVDFDVQWVGDAVPDHVDAVVDRDETTRLLAGLTERQRAAVVLRYYHSSTDSEIAAALGCREATVRSLLRRALLAMRERRDLHPDGSSDRRHH